jgi:formylmethanofuran dehydrogenase subunit E
MRFSQYRCNSCQRELRGSKYKAMGVCNQCYNDGKTAISSNKLKANSLPKNLLTPNLIPIPFKDLSQPQDLNQIFHRTHCQKCGELSFLRLMNDGLCMKCRF